MKQRGVTALVLDATTFLRSDYRYELGKFELRLDGSWHDLAASRRGWIRRTVPPTWAENVVIGSREAAEHGAFAALLKVILYGIGIRWLTSPVDLWLGEEKPFQQRAAAMLGIPTPNTVITNRSSLIGETLGDEIIAKPLGTNQFVEGDKLRVVFATVLRRGDVRLSRLGDAPFILQDRIRAEAHLRVVTVGEAVWVAQLDVDEAQGADWRASSEAHFQFHAPKRVDPALLASAVRVAKELRLSYSSQDWIFDGQTNWLVDVNPSGQWLFLPDPLKREVADAIAVAILAD